MDEVVINEKNILVPLEELREPFCLLLLYDKGLTAKAYLYVKNRSYKTDVDTAIIAKDDTSFVSTELKGLDTTEVQPVRFRAVSKVSYTEDKKRT